MAEHVLIHFAGEGSGTGGLTWGQKGVWRSILMDGEAKTMGGVVKIPGGTTVARISDSMRFVLGRHQALRTRLRFGPDGPAGPVRQEVHESGEIPLEIVEAAPDEDADVVAAELQRRYRFTPFDYERDWPVRIGAVRQAGVVTHTVAVYLHTSMDALGLTVLVQDLAGHLAGREAGPVTAMQPLELAAKEGGPAAQRQSRTSLQHMESVLRAVPAEPWPSTGADTDEHDTLYHWSPRLALAVTTVAGRMGIDTSPVLLGMYAVSLGRVTGINPMAVQMAVSNRFRPRLGDTVAPLAQVAPCLLDVAGTSLAGAVGKAWRGAMTAYKHAYYDPAGRSELVRRLTAECGKQVDLFVFFNDRRRPGETAVPEPDPAGLSEQLAALRDRSTVRWDLVAGPMREAVYLDVDDRAGALELVLTVDLRILTRADAERMLRGMEDLAAQLAVDPDAAAPVQAGAGAEPAAAW
jgi:hypothetical protein